jgi:TRAP-type mannitol/chloroaromatic compound transport system permease small subunit
MDLLLARIETLNRLFGRIAAWCLVSMMMVQVLVVLLRYVFRTGFLWMQESVVYLHVAAALLAAGFALANQAHVRVDVFYAPASRRARAAIDLAGAVIFLLPFCGAVLYLSLPFAASSWAVLEGSIQPSGIPAVFLLKSALVLFPVLLGLQGLVFAARAFRNLMPNGARASAETENGSR